MSSINLKGLKPGDLAEYQQPLSTSTTHGIFQRWHSTDDGLARLIVRSQQLVIDFSVDPKQVISITHPGEGHA